VAVLVAVFGLVIWGVGSRGSQRLSHGNPSPTATTPGRPLLTRSCTPQEMAFNGAITDCAVPSRPIGNCTVDDVSTDCPVPSGPKGACTAPTTPPGTFSMTISLRGATKSLYELSLGVTHGHHGDGTYATNRSPDPVTGQPRAEIAIAIADSFTHRFWEAESGTLEITQSGEAGTASAVMRPTSGPQGPGSGGAFLLDGQWKCG
jgi:hypothetical protein